MGANTGCPFTSRMIAGLKLMKMVGGSFFTAVTGGGAGFFTLAVSRSSDMVIEAAGFRNVRTSASICGTFAGSRDGK